MAPEIEPDGQQFLDARDDDIGDGDGRPPPPGAPPGPPAAGATRRTTILIGGLLILVIGLGVVGVVALTSGGNKVDDLATEGDGVDIRDRDVETTTSDPDATTTEVPETTTTLAFVPVPDFATPGGPATQGLPGAPVPPGAPGAPGVACPGGGLANQVVRQSAGQPYPNRWHLELSGTSTNNTNAAVVVKLDIIVSHGGTALPNPWTSTATQAKPVLQPGETSNWTFEADINTPSPPTVDSLGGGFTWADPQYSHCPTGS